MITNLTWILLSQFIYWIIGIAIVNEIHFKAKYIWVWEGDGDISCLYLVWFAIMAIWELPISIVSVVIIGK